MNALPRRKLLLSIHDVSPRFEPALDRLEAELAAMVPSERIARLVVPNHWGSAPIRAGSPFAAKLRRWAEQGSEIFLHGSMHRDDSRHPAGIARFKARHLTAGEGEFLGLDREPALRRMAEGKALIEDITGRPVAGFIAPAWLYGPGAMAALAESGFPLAEDHWKVWSPRTGALLAKGPVLTWASRSRLRIASSLLAAAVLPPVLERLAVARIAVHPGDAAVPVLVSSIRKAVGALLRSHDPSRYGELAAEGS